MAKLTPRELRFMRLMYPDGTIAIGLTVGANLLRRGYLQINQSRRYFLTRKGLIAVAASNKAAA